MKKLMIIAFLGAFVFTSTIACTNNGIDEDLTELSIEPEKVDLGNGDKAEELEQEEDEGV